LFIHHFIFWAMQSKTIYLDAQRFALPACGRAWTMLGSRKNPKPEKCSKMPQNPQRQVHPEQGRTPILNEKNQSAGTFRMCPRAGSLGRFVRRLCGGVILL